MGESASSLQRHRGWKELQKDTKNKQTTLLLISCLHNVAAIFTLIIIISFTLLFLLSSALCDSSHEKRKCPVSGRTAFLNQSAREERLRMKSSHDILGEVIPVKAEGNRVCTVWLLESQNCHLRTGSTSSFRISCFPSPAWGSQC